MSDSALPPHRTLRRTKKKEAVPPRAPINNCFEHPEVVNYNIANDTIRHYENESKVTASPVTAPTLPHGNYSKSGSNCLPDYSGSDAPPSSLALSDKVLRPVRYEGNHESQIKSAVFGFPTTPTKKAVGTVRVLEDGTKITSFVNFSPRSVRSADSDGFRVPLFPELTPETTPERNLMSEITSMLHCTTEHDRRVARKLSFTDVVDEVPVGLEVVCTTALDISSTADESKKSCDSTKVEKAFERDYQGSLSYDEYTATSSAGSLSEIKCDSITESTQLSEQSTSAVPGSSENVDTTGIVSSVSIDTSHKNQSNEATPVSSTDSNNGSIILDTIPTSFVAFKGHLLDTIRRTIKGKARISRICLSELFRRKDQHQRDGPEENYSPSAENSSNSSGQTLVADSSQRRHSAAISSYSKSPLSHSVETIFNPWSINSRDGSTRTPKSSFTSESTDEESTVDRYLALCDGGDSVRVPTTGCFEDPNDPASYYVPEHTQSDIDNDIPTPPSGICHRPAFYTLLEPFDSDSSSFIWTIDRHNRPGPSRVIRGHRYEDSLYGVTNYNTPGNQSQTSLFSETTETVMRCTPFESGTSYYLGQKPVTTAAFPSIASRIAGKVEADNATGPAETHPFLITPRAIQDLIPVSNEFPEKPACVYQLVADMNSFNIFEEKVVFHGGSGMFMASNISTTGGGENNYSCSEEDTACQQQKDGLFAAVGLRVHKSIDMLMNKVVRQFGA